MKTDTGNGDQFAAGGQLLENKALRIGDTNKANEEQDLRFARTDEERRAIRLEALKAKSRDLAARERQAGDDAPDASEATNIAEDGDEAET